MLDFFFNDTATTEIYTLSLHDALPISVLQSLNLSAQEIVGIQVNNAIPPTPIPYAAQTRLESAVADASTPVEGGEQAVNARVTLQIRY